MVILHKINNGGVNIGNANPSEITYVGNSVTFKISRFIQKKQGFNRAANSSEKLGVCKLLSK